MIADNAINNIDINEINKIVPVVYPEKSELLINNIMKINLQKIPKKKAIIKTISKLALPAVFSSLIIYSLETINLIFASKIKPIGDDFSNLDLINAIGMGNIFMNFCGFLFGLGLITSLETLCSQSYGKNDHKCLAKWALLCQYFMTAYFVLLAIISFFSKNIIMFLGQPENIAILSSQYVFALVPSFIIQFHLAIYTKVLNSQQIYYPILVINAICLILHPAWCYIFYVFFDLNVLGLGLAYTLTSLLMLAMIYYYVVKGKFLVSVKLKEISWEDVKIFSKTAITCGILCSTDVLAFEIVSVIASFLPQNQLDANIVVINIYNNIYSISIGFSTALTILVGNYIGQNKPKLALKFSQMGILINFSLIVVIGMMCIFFHRYIALLYLNNKAVLKYSSNLMRVVGIFIIFDAIQLQLSGIIRGVGKLNQGMIAGIIIFIFMQTGLCSFFVLYLKSGVYGLWFAQIICSIAACIVYFILLKRTDWKKMAKEASSVAYDFNFDDENGILNNEEKKIIIESPKSKFSDSTKDTSHNAQHDFE